MKRLFAAGLALLLMGQSSPPARVAELGWMSGRWETEGTNGNLTQENWSEPRGGVMLGYSRSGTEERLREFEFLRIQAGEDGVPTYFAQPGGRPPIGFRLVAHDATSATFENPQHDFPQRIRYERRAGTMMATISRLDGSNAMRWQYRLKP
jgi:Domain of unknown function (DUF6265)